MRERARSSLLSACILCQRNLVRVLAINSARGQLAFSAAHTQRLIPQPLYENKRRTNHPAGPPMKIDLHIYRPKDLKNDGLARIIQQAWETGAEKLCLVHGHGRSRGR